MRTVYIADWFIYENYTLEQFYPAYAIASLMHILDDAALSNQYRKNVVEAVITILRKLGAKSEQFGKFVCF
jgi:hypothetical protein